MASTGIMPGVAEKVRHMAGITNWVHPAVALLPPAGGSAQVSCREDSQDGEIQHQSELAYPQQAVKDFSLAESAGLALAKPQPPQFQMPSQHDGLAYSKEQLKECHFAANDKRVKEYDRQLEEALDYEEEYKTACANSVTREEMLDKRRSYEKIFVTEPGKTQLAVSIPIEAPLQGLLAEARDDVVNCLLLMSGMHSREEAGDMETSSTWIPDFAHIPQKDLHITVCIPSLWREPGCDPKAHDLYNAAVGTALRTVAADHEGFVVELERIMLSKDGSLLAVFRTVGPTGTCHEILSDRASEALDPMTSLRSDVLYVFLEKKLSHVQRQNELDLLQAHQHPHLLRQATIVKTVGGSAHGYIHCSLSRLAVAPELTKKPLELKLLHRVCRSWTAKLAGRRMAVRGFTLSEMTGLGQGKNKNPFDKARWPRARLQQISLNQRGGPLDAASDCVFGVCFAFYVTVRLRKNTWLEQYSQVSESNDFRREVADCLEESSMATRRLVTPILHYRPVELHLMQVIKQAKERGVPFGQMVETAENQRILMDFRNAIDNDGAKGAEHLFLDWRQREIQQSADSRRQKVEGPQAESSMKEVQDGLSFATKYRKDGVVDWDRGCPEDALQAWRLGCEVLQRIRVPEADPAMKFFSELKVALLKNRALAALKLNSWQEALESADQVLKIDDQDHKAWFRKACALEGLGKLEEVERCLDMIDGIAVGRPDRDRLEHEIKAKREKVKALRSKDEVSQQRMLQLGLQKCLFSEEREPQPSAAPELPALQAAPESQAAARVEDATRKRLTRDGAEDLLKELERAYAEPSFREQVRKLARDVSSQEEFTRYLDKVAFPVQKPVLERWGFEATAFGVVEMRCAIQDHTADPQLKRQSDATTRALYGEMYNAVRGAKEPEPDVRR
ncbi:unnamed protein product [Effrenium voratum]|nr:unnamed protein product [Effrenium voratum]